MAIRWTTEHVARWQDDGLLVEEVRSCGRWRLRAISNRASARPSMVDFDVILAVADQMVLRLRPFGVDGPFQAAARAQGASLQITEDITRGVRHQVTVRTKPSDDAVTRWSCTCGTSSRGATSPEAAREAADAHVVFATDGERRLTDRAVLQGADGRWAQAQVSIAGRFRACVRSDVSPARVHLSGAGEDFELAVDGRLGLWVRRLGSDAALRKDEDGRGVSLLAFDSGA